MWLAFPVYCWLWWKYGKLKFNYAILSINYLLRENANLRYVTRGTVKMNTELIRPCIERDTSLWHFQYIKESVFKFPSVHSWKFHSVPTRIPDTRCTFKSINFTFSSRHDKFYLWAWMGRECCVRRAFIRKWLIHGVNYIALWKIKFNLSFA